MASKCLVAINMGGGMDGLNMVSMRDATSVTHIQNLRQGAPANVLNYGEATTKTVNTTANSAVLTGVNTTGLIVGMRVYGDLIPRVRNLLITAIDAGASTVTLSGVVPSTNTGISLYFATEFQLYKMNENPDVGKNYGLHYTQAYLADKFNVADTAPNAGKYKAAFISNIGPMRAKLFITPGQGIFDFQVQNPDGSTRAGMESDKAPRLTSHNDQTSIWLTNRPEGAIEGWGGGIADTFLNELSGTLNIPLASVSSSGAEAFISGTEVNGFLISSNGLVRRVPGYTERGLYDSNSTNEATLTGLIKTASALVPTAETNRILKTAVTSNQIANAYQDVLLDVMEITDPPPSAGSQYIGGSGANPMAFCANLKQIARMILANNPNRGFIASRTGTTVTLTTQTSAGLATRVAGSTTVRIFSANHGLFTSTTNSNVTSDSVLITGDTVSINATTPANGYKITLDPLDPDNAFTITTADTTALSNVAVTFRLKHNLKTVNKVFITDSGFDTTIPADGYQVATVPNNFTITLTTTASGALPNANAMLVKAKLINLPKQILYTGTPGFSWDSHDYANHDQLFALNHALTYFFSLVERIPDANVLLCSITEFGRTTGVNSKGTDHGWGNYAFVVGKDVKGNKMHGTPIDLTPNGIHNIGFLFATTAVYQYTSTIAKWMGATDAEVLELFPDLVNWNPSERYLDFLYV